MVIAGDRIEVRSLIIQFAFLLQRYSSADERSAVVLVHFIHPSPLFLTISIRYSIVEDERRGVMENIEISMQNVLQ